MFDNLQGSLADVVGSTPDYDHYDEGLYYDLALDFDLDDFEDDRDAYFDGIDVDADDPEAPEIELGYDPREIIAPHRSGVSVARCLGIRCWDDSRCRAQYRHYPKYNSKPKRKNHRA
jgi:hypothetical protein